jgi:predicted glutamine amidotransferase
MCQLLGMNCNVPTDICFSFTGFQARGGATDVHSDGWGIAFFEGRGTRVFLDPKPSCTSPVAELVRQYPIRSKSVIAHIRKATQGAIGLENTHPFMRELWGRYWIFAHNGNLVDFAPALDGSFVPVGLTDSERAFCWLLQRLRQRFRQHAAWAGRTVRRHPRADARHRALRGIQLSALQRRLAVRPRLDQARLHRAPGAIRPGPPQGSGCDGRFQRRHDPGRSRRRHRDAAADRQRGLETMPAGTLWWFAEGEPVQTVTTVPGPARKAA